jgi:carbon-monoxide dehydrogenase medium subunit
MQVVGPKTERLIAAEKFFVDPFQTSMERNEILARVLVPETPPSSGGVYQRLCYVHGAFPVVGVAAIVTMKAKVVDRVGIGLTGVGATALRPKKAEDSLLGKAPSADNLDKASLIAAESTNPTSDIHASAEYRRDMVRVFTRRALEAAVARASGGKA